MRPDQLMSLAWKVLTPMALVQLLLAGVVSGVIG
jgi:NADH:ubiquinone oxidoreductase subunit H